LAIFAPEEQTPSKKIHLNLRFLGQFAGFVADASITTSFCRDQKLTLIFDQTAYNNAMFPGNGRRQQHV
jgi:hypothetical protein